MAQLQRLVVEFKAEELIVRALYRSKGDLNPGTKGRTTEVTALARSGLARALEALDAGAECVGTSGFTTREDLLVVDTSEADARIASEAEGSAA